MSSDRLGFLSLPLECRYMVYEYLFRGTVMRLTQPNGSPSSPKGVLAFLLTSRAIHNEVGPMIYQSPKRRVGGCSEYLRLLDTKFPRLIANIKTLQFDEDYSQTYYDSGLNFVNGGWSPHLRNRSCFPRLKQLHLIIPNHFDLQSKPTGEFLAGIPDEEFINIATSRLQQYEEYLPGIRFADVEIILTTKFYFRTWGEYDVLLLVSVLSINKSQCKLLERRVPLPDE